MKILIRFSGDNDFSNVLHAFGDLLVSPIGSRTWRPERLTKANIVRWFNAVAPTLYEAVQARDYVQPVTEGYLNITEEEVFFGDEEVGGKMDSYASWGNGDSVLIDFGDEHHEPTVTVL